jgi:lipoate synthase
MQQDNQTGEVTTSIEELAIYNMVLTEAIYELLADKGVLNRAEVTERIKKLKRETKVNLRPPN